jgi:hypothetical protein
MPSDTPLDDLIGQTFYIGGSLWRYLYNTSLRRFALRRTVQNIPLDLAAELIASGEVLWIPPERFDRPGPEDSIESMRQRIALLEAYRQSPACVESDDWTARARIDAQLIVIRHWLTRRALSSGDAADGASGTK